MIRCLSCAITGVLFLVSANGTAAPAKKDATQAAPIVVGEVAPLSGSDANYGQSVDHGIQLAIEQANARGGIRGRTISLRTADDQSRPEEAAKAARSLIDSEHVTALLGDVTSTLSLAVAPIAQEKGVPMITPSSTSPKVTQVGNFIFRSCFADSFQGRILARFARDTLKVSKVAIVRDTASEYSMGLANTFAETFKAAGGEIVAHETYSKGSLDFRKKLTQIKAANPQAIFVPGYDSDVAFIARQAREIGIPKSVPLLGGDGWDSTELMEVGGMALEGSYFSNHYSADDKEARVQAFVKAFEKRFGAKPDASAAMGFDAAGILISALEKAPDLSGPALRDAIAATTDFPGVTGNITINSDRTGAVVLKVKQRQYEFVARVNP